jgi:prevent-host-death family protein
MSDIRMGRGGSHATRCGLKKLPVVGKVIRTVNL